MRRLQGIVIGLVIGGAAVMGCGDDGSSGGGETASATFMGTNGQTVTGTAKFTKSGSAVSVTLTFTAAPAGVHGVHIHNVPSCGNEGTDAGPHWDDNDTGATGHHLPPGSGHLGDLGNVTIAAGGTGTLTFSNPAWTLGDGGATDVVPRAIIFHEKMDDGTMPSAGLRWGCALVAMD